MKIKMTENIFEANLVTHAGTFHADEVMATVILGKVFHEITVCRTTKVPDKLKRGTIVYDIGGGCYDHHQIGGNGRRENGVPFAAAGLIWGKFGSKVLAKYGNPSGVWKKIDRALIQGIDAVDNGTMPAVDYPAYTMGISQIISGFNPCWDSNESSDEAFVKAVLFAETIFDNVLKSTISRVKARTIVEEEINKTEGHILVLDRFVTWKEAICSPWCENAKNIWFVVFPSNRDGYNWHGVSKEYGEFELRVPVPKEWRGLYAEELQEVTGVETASFCHRDGFVGGAETLEDTIKMVELAIKAYENK